MTDMPDMVAFDFETSGALPEYALQPWRVAQGKSWATSLAIVRKQGNALQIKGGLAPSVKDMRSFLEEAIAKGEYIVGWNTVFDVQWLLAYGLGDLVFKAKWLDGMLLWRHWFLEPEYDTTRPNKKSYGLKACVEEHLPQFAGYQEDIDFHDISPAARKKLHDYNVRDTMFTLRLTQKWYKKLADYPERLKAAMIEAACIPLVAQANLNGMIVDTLTTRELAAYLDDVANAQLKQLAPHGITEAVVRSPKQLSTLMFDKWKLPVLKENTSKITGNVSRSTDKEVLHELSFADPRAKQVHLYREALGNKTKFADTLLISADYNGDNRTRPSAIIFGTYSGRMTYASKQGKNKDARQTGFALHQEKRGSLYRNAIMAPPGYTLVEFDAAGQEFRWMAIAANDPVMLQLCMPGEDAHSYMGSRIVGSDYHELIELVHANDEKAVAIRKLGKVANLSLQYRTSAPRLKVTARVQYGIPMELPQAERIHATYKRSYTGVPKYWDWQIRQTKSSGYVETFAGRRVMVVGDWGGKMSWSMGSTAINYRIQGTGADQKYLALAVIKPVLVQFGIYFAWDLHDGMYFYVPNDKVKKAVLMLKSLLDNLPYKKAWGFTPPIGLPWDCKIGPSWGMLEEYKND